MRKLSSQINMDMNERFIPLNMYTTGYMIRDLFTKYNIHKKFLLATMPDIPGIWERLGYEKHKPVYKLSSHEVPILTLMELKLIIDSYYDNSLRCKPLIAKKYKWFTPLSRRTNINTRFVQDCPNTQREKILKQIKYKKR